MSASKSVAPFDLGTFDIISPDQYAKNGYPHHEWTYLRRHAPVYYYDHPDVRPFWAITKHTDVAEISWQPNLFLDAPQLVIATREVGLDPQRKRVVRHLLNMDPPEHSKYRELLSRPFTPRAVRALQAKVAEIGQQLMREITRRSTHGALECDFVTDVAASIPIDVIGTLLAGYPSQTATALSLDKRERQLSGSRVPAGYERAADDSPIPRSSV
jgi:cholest-4-en-3-one 26-monooxygenase